MPREGLRCLGVSPAELVEDGVGWAGGTAPRQDGHLAGGAWHGDGAPVAAQAALPRASGRLQSPGVRVRLSFSPLPPSPPPQVEESRSGRVPRGSFGTVLICLLALRHRGRALAALLIHPPRALPRSLSFRPLGKSAAKKRKRI